TVLSVQAPHLREQGVGVRAHPTYEAPLPDPGPVSPVAFARPARYLSGGKLPANSRSDRAQSLDCGVVASVVTLDVRSDDFGLEDLYVDRTFGAKTLRLVDHITPRGQSHHLV